MQLVVVGGGLSGVSASLAARAAGASVSLVRGRAGASALSSGAWDLAGWNVPGGDRARLPDNAVELLAVAKAPVTIEDALVVGVSGVLRPSRARDVQVLGLPSSLLEGSVPSFGLVVVPRLPIGTWDADAIATSLDETLRAAGHAGARAASATLVRHRDELRAPVADPARAHDDGARGAWLVDRLREVIASVGGERSIAAIVLPPILGIDEAVIARVRAALGVPIGESLGEPGGPAALRHGRWTDRALKAAGVTLLDGEVTHVSEGAVQVTGGAARAYVADRVVLAAGGIDAGGMVFGTREHEPGGIFPHGPRAAIRLVVTIGGAEVMPVLDGAPIDPAASLFGLDGDRLLLGRSPALLRAGLPVDARGVVLDRVGAPVPWLLAAGDLVAGAPRTALSAIVSGLRAGTSAAESV